MYLLIAQGQRLDLLKKASFSNSRISLDQHDTELTGARFLQRVVEVVKIRLPANEARGRSRDIWQSLLRRPTKLPRHGRAPFV